MHAIQILILEVARNVLMIAGGGTVCSIITLDHPSSDISDPDQPSLNISVSCSSGSFLSFIMLGCIALLSCLFSVQGEMISRHVV